MWTFSLRISDHLVVKEMTSKTEEITEYDIHLVQIAKKDINILLKITK